MALLSLSSEGLWMLDYELKPFEFWPYTTIVYDVVMTGPRDKFEQLHKDLLKLFNEAGIKAIEDNKTAFGLTNAKGVVWYFGFKDFRFDLGMTVRSDDWIKPHVKEA